MGSWNPNQLFGRLDIRSKLAIAFLGLAGVPLALVGWYAAQQHLRSLTETATQEQRRGLVAVRERVQSFLGGVEGDLELLAGSAALEELLAKFHGSSVSVPRHGETHLETLEGVFSAFLNSKRFYYRLRLLSDSGIELAYVALVDGEPRVVTPGRWSGTGYRFYRTLVDGLSGEQVGFAPVELRGLPESIDAEGDLAPEDLPDASPRPVAALSFVRAIRDEPRGAMRGILVVDVDARWLFELLQPPELRPGESLVLVGPDGHYLFHSSKKTDWNTLLATERDFNLRGDLPEWIADRALGGDSGVETEGLDSVVAYAPLFEAQYRALGNYTLVSIIPKDVLFAPARALRRFIFGSGTLTILAAGFLALLAAHQFAAPIRALTRGAARLAEGEFQAPLDIRTNDEIEDLARSFSAMAGALERREREITRQGEQLNALLDNMGEGVAVIDRHYRVRFLNRFLQQRFGPAEGRSCFELFMGTDGPCSECPRHVGVGDEGQAGGVAVTPAAAEARDLCRQGRAVDGRYYEVLAYPLEDFEGQTALLEIHRDITERREMEQKLQRYTEHLEGMVAERTRELERSQAKLIQQEKMVAVGQLAAGVAHELGTPLATILCHAQMVRDDIDVLTEHREEPPFPGGGDLVTGSVEMVAEEAGRCRDIVRNLLEFSRPSSPDVSVVSVETVVSKSLSLLEHDLQKRGIVVDVVDDGSDARIRCNENSMVQVFINLMLNAADAMPEGGHLGIRTRAHGAPSRQGGGHGGPARPGAAASRASPSSRRVTVVVEDDGHGIDPETQGRIFEPFFTTKEPGSGTGLGLWVVYNTVAEQGGSIEVASREGEGTAFTLELPLVDEEEGA